ncbi:MAG: Uma2 family endonuclease [Chloroflexi bacterium]|nr:Uma2 family endonuclease [Chloroflexota bacterium]
MVLSNTAETVKELVTAEELWLMGSRGENYELVRGELIETTPPGGKHGNTASRLNTRLSNLVEASGLGMVMVETGYRLSPPATRPQKFTIKCRIIWPTARQWSG